MAITLRGTASSSTLDITHPAGIAAGDVVYLAHSIRTSVRTDKNMDMVTAGYTELADIFADDQQESNLGVFRKIQGSPPDSTATVVDNGSGIIVEMVLIGVDQTTPEDATTTTATGIDGATPNPPSIITATAGAWVLAAAGTTEPDGVTNAPTGYSDLIDLQTANQNGMMSRKEISSPATEDPGAYSDIVGDTNDAWTAATVAVRPAAEGGGAAVLIRPRHLMLLGAGM